MRKFLHAIFALMLSVDSLNSLNIINSYRDFKVYWNVPTFQCHPHKIYFDQLAKKYGIIMNKDDAFKGEEMTILYDPGNFPALLYKEGNSEPVWRNGGLPQEGNLTDHLMNFEERVNKDMPDYSYNGVAVIDFESWRPIFRQNWGTLQPYKNFSIENERKKHPTWTLAQLTKEAISRFELAGQEFVEMTLLLAKSLRPNATWGYYAYPYCFNMQSIPLTESCHKDVLVENDKLDYMFTNTDAFHPSLYLPQIRLNEEQRIQLIEGKIAESLRINGNYENGKKILPYFWYNYQDTKNFLSTDDLRNSFIVLKSHNIDGVIIWGSSNDVNQTSKCQNLYDYVDNILGPTIIST